MRNLLSKPQQNRSTGSDEVLKATALLYLEEALFKEQFEDCSGLIQSAQRFGAQLYEIKAVIFRYLNKAQGSLKNEAPRNQYGYPRFKGGK